ncbi:MAG: autotransporter outer membrane beta-barrel domain-containing protein [Candidatus Omnitrophica bacterium]|nr:autotransporter outer membrane beta-barrel domain-containing protein [Candidatus Omnitrophota bacterium]
MQKFARGIFVLAFLLMSARVYAAGQWELGSELSWIKYEEPDVMEQKGLMYGVFTGYTYRPHENGKVSSFSELFSNGNSLNMFAVDARLGFGQVDYTSNSYGSLDDIDDIIFEVRGRTGYDFPVAEDSRITPFVGFGYRYLNDDSSGMVTTTGLSGYEREANYFYIPIGVEASTALENDWSLGASLEYDIFIAGRQKTHLDTLAENEQDKGYGVRGSVRASKKLENINVFVEPYVRYWNVDDSDSVPVIYNGLPYSGQEPENNSLETGVRVGFIF